MNKGTHGGRSNLRAFSYLDFHEEGSSSYGSAWKERWELGLAGQPCLRLIYSNKTHGDQIQTDRIYKEGLFPVSCTVEKSSLREREGVRV